VQEDKKMSIHRDEFAMNVSHYNKQYTPRQIAEYIANTSGDGFADEKKLQTLIGQSQAKLQSAMKQHGLTIDQVLQAEASPAGKELAALALQHCDQAIYLIVDGGLERGSMI
jgi:hypothetical protein